MTALAAAFTDAGYLTPQIRLHLVAVQSIEAYPKDFQAAWAMFRSLVALDQELTWALFARYEEAAIRPVLAKAAEEYHRKRKPKVVRDGGLRKHDNHHECAPAAQLSSGRDAVLAIARKSLLDTFQINGRALGDVGATEARSWAAARKRDARFVEIITAGIPHDDHKPLREWVKPDEADAAYKRAKEIGNE